jgi:S-(hydroxymethyl)glutathione dehydrogenase / alcohol dehydrogenase
MVAGCVGWVCEHAADRVGEPYGWDDSGAPLYPGLSTAAFAQHTVVPARACYPLLANLMWVPPWRSG